MIGGKDKMEIFKLKITTIRQKQGVINPDIGN
jgi:hypothetical protein